MKQGYNARLDESLGGRNGKKKQSLKSRRDESKAMSKKSSGHSYAPIDNNISFKKHNHLK